MNNKLQYYCFDCGIPVNDFQERFLNYSQAFVCPTCAAKYSKDLVEIAKINGVALRPQGRTERRAHQPRWNYPNSRSHRPMCEVYNVNWNPDFLNLPNDIKAAEDQFIFKILDEEMKKCLLSTFNDKELDKSRRLSFSDIARAMFPIEPLPENAKLTYDFGDDIFDISNVLEEDTF